jgi:hypothetical protein
LEGNAVNGTDGNFGKVTFERRKGLHLEQEMFRKREVTLNENYLETKETSAETGE